MKSLGKSKANFHKVLARRERVLRETQIRNIHEWEKLKSLQEMRIDEFSRKEQRESHAIVQELTSQVQEVQERMNYMNVFRVSRYRVDLQWKIISRSQSAVVPSPRAMSSRDQRLRFDTWNLSGTQETFLAIHVQ